MTTRKTARQSPHEKITLRQFTIMVNVVLAPNEGAGAKPTVARHAREQLTKVFCERLKMISPTTPLPTTRLHQEALAGSWVARVMHTIKAAYAHAGDAPIWDELVRCSGGSFQRKELYPDAADAHDCAMFAAAAGAIRRWLSNGQSRAVNYTPTFTD